VYAAANISGTSIKPVHTASAWACVIAALMAFDLRFQWGKDTVLPSMLLDANCFMFDVLAGPLNSYLQASLLSSCLPSLLLPGGHLNPAVTCSTLLAGFYPLLHSLIYIALQICGSIVGALLVVGLMPNTYVGMGDGAPGELLAVVALNL
jgi:hypothetical protein